MAVCELDSSCSRNEHMVKSFEHVIETLRFRYALRHMVLERHSPRVKLHGCKPDRAHSSFDKTRNAQSNALISTYAFIVCAETNFTLINSLYLTKILYSVFHKIFFFFFFFFLCFFFKSLFIF
jgi:hypothetical protein